MELIPLIAVQQTRVIRSLQDMKTKCKKQGADFLSSRSVCHGVALVVIAAFLAGGELKGQNSVQPTPGVGSSEPDPGAPWPDPDAPWPEAEKKGLRTKSRKPSAIQKSAQTPGPSTPPASASQPATEVDFRNVPLVKGIVVHTSVKEFNPEGVPSKEGLTVPKHSLLDTSEFASLAARYIGRPLSEATMREMQREIILYYRKHDRPLADVIYQEQDASNGMIQVTVIEGRLKEIQVLDKQGNPYTNGWSGVKFLHDSIHLRTNEVISESSLMKDLDWLGRNPFREIQAVYEPSKREFGYTSIQLRVDERRQWSADVGYEDSGNRITSDDRITAGVTWGKAFGLTDNQFRYAFTFDPTLEFLQAHSASYYLPLPWRHGLRLSGYYLDVKGKVDQNTTLQGSSYQMSGRYEIPLPALGKYQQEVSFGLDYKYNDNSLVFGSANTANTPTEVFQLAAGYSSALPDRWGRTSFSLSGYFSPGDVTELNTDKAFDLARTGAKADYAYARFNVERNTRLPADFAWLVRGMAQIATGNLLTSEQLGLGGYSTVRGYDEREVNKDEGVFFSTELRTPAFSVPRLFDKSPSCDDKLQLLGFWDYARSRNVHETGGQLNNPYTDMSSAGVGLRYSFTRHFSLRFDYGWQLIDISRSRTGNNSRGHIGVVATY